MPLYASKQLRTITFGQGITYDPEAPATDEKLRIVHTLQASMETMYATEREELVRRANTRREHLRRHRDHLRPQERVELAALEQQDDTVEAATDALNTSRF